MEKEGDGGGREKLGREHDLKGAGPEYRNRGQR